MALSSCECRPESGVWQSRSPGGPRLLPATLLTPLVGLKGGEERGREREKRETEYLARVRGVYSTLISIPSLGVASLARP